MNNIGKVREEKLKKYKRVMFLKRTEAKDCR